MIYFQVFEYYEEENRPKRLIYTFDNEMAAHDLVECIMRNDPCKPNVGTEEYETTT